MLAVAALALLAAFTAANVATMNLRVSSTVANSSIAESLAESAVQQALANLREDLGTMEAVEIDGSSEGLADGSRGFLTFDDSSDVYSTNNFLGDRPDGWQRALPASTAHLVGVGMSGGVTRYCEVVVHLPEFPVVMGCDGTVEVSNSFIGGFSPDEDREWVAGEGYTVEDDEIEPGHLVTNQEGPNSIVLDSRTKVTGDVQSKGAVNLGGATVEGEVRASWARPAPLPVFNLLEFDPARDEDVHYDKLLNPAGSLNLVGNVRRAGNLNLSGDLRLDNAFLFVTGDLTVRGSVRGQGAVIALGRVEFPGAVDLTGGEQLAVLSGRGIDLVGDDPARSIFKGLLYTNGDFNAEKVTIVGGFVVQGGGATVVRDSSVYFSDVHISSPLRRETAAAIPRFTIPDQSLGENILRLDESGLPIGRWQPSAASEVRDVSNVVDEDDPDWRISSWELTDPAVIRVQWVNEEPQIRYYWWGTGPTLGKLPRDRDYWTDPEEAADYIAAENTGENFALTGQSDVVGNLNGTPPNRAQYKAYILSVINHLQRLSHPSGDYNFSLDPNEFVGDDDEIRVLLHRVF